MNLPNLSRNRTPRVTPIDDNIFRVISAGLYTAFPLPVFSFFARVLVFVFLESIFRAFSRYDVPCTESAQENNMVINCSWHKKFGTM